MIIHMHHAGAKLSKILLLLLLSLSPVVVAVKGRILHRIYVHMYVQCTYVYVSTYRFHPFQMQGFQDF
jgi:hypothetical protein